MNSLVVLFTVMGLAAAGHASVLAPAPLAYSAPVLAAPAAVSHQSRLDIKSSPAVVSTYAAAAPVAYTAPLAYSAPLAYGTPLTYGAPLAYSAPLAAAAIAPAAVSHQSRFDIKSSPAVVSTSYAAAPIAYSTPALIKTAAIATPAFATAAFAAPVVAGTHLIKKRSVFAYLHAKLKPIAPVRSYASYTPLTYPSPLISKAYSVYHW